jgi:hypothetical protein
MFKKYFTLIPILTFGLMIGSGIVYSYSVYAQSTTFSTILECFHEGDTMVEVPNVEDFKMKQTGIFIEARWTNPVTKEQEVLATTLPCVYHVTQPAAGARSAN